MSDGCETGASADGRQLRKAYGRGGRYQNLVNDDEDCEFETGVVIMPAETARRKEQIYSGLDAEMCGGGHATRVAGDAAGAKGDKTSRRLTVFGGLNLVYVVLQLWGSMAFDSLALLSDGFHNLSDV